MIALYVITALWMLLTGYAAVVTIVYCSRKWPRRNEFLSIKDPKHPEHSRYVEKAQEWEAAHGKPWPYWPPKKPWYRRISLINRYL